MIKRRDFLTLGATTLGIVVLSKCGLAQNNYSKNQILTKSYTSQNGLLNVDLVASNITYTLGEQKANLIAYNGQVPGPLLEANPGDTVRIRFTNKLSQPSNLHYHGLHIPNTGNGDNVFLEVSPGETFNYEFTIPKNHQAGIFWYHPHIHHLTADQVFGGLAGLFIVRGELDEIPEIKASQEKFLVLQDFALDNHLSPMSKIMGREGNLITINGQVNPILSIPEGGLLRLRLLNASVSRFYRLSLEDHPFYLIATDGGGIAQPVELKELLLTPGERAEILIKGDKKKGKYRLLNLPYNRETMGMMDGGMMGGGMNHNMGKQRNNDNTSEVLATLVYQGSISPLSLPTKLINLKALPEAQNIRRMELSMDMIPGKGMVLQIDGKNFDPQQINTKVKLNTIEDWEIVTVGSHLMEHNFHLHTYPFQVLSRNGEPEPYLAWKDTVLIKPNEPVKIRVKFSNFPGKTVYHCHILDHEDLGMMGVINIT